MGKITLVAFGLFFSFVFALNAKAMDYGIIYQDAAISNAVISPVKGDPDGKAILRFNLKNTAVDQLIIMGVTGSLHDGSKIMARMAPQKFVELDSLSLLSEEALNMKEAHIYIELENMKLPTGKSNLVDLSLILTTGEMPFKARLVNITN
ncbi:hypothetical protein [Sneathiella aquimaris]|uniref:hypothetical protein n=1 Tax=Sneathiella aquimaris TaxID=2599305 RepID=UPI00146C2013|nr:hypothetical protein [Sneathiella aquimaris]